MTTTPCTTCGKALAATDVLYNERAQPVCADCSTKAEIAGDETRAARNLKISALTAAGAAIAGFVAFYVGFSLGFWVFAIGAVASGCYAVNGMASPGSARFTALLSPNAKRLIWTCCAVAFAIVGFEALVFGGVVRFHVLYP